MIINRTITVSVVIDDLPRVIREAREQLGLTIAAASRKAGLDQSHWRHIENGRYKSIPERTLDKILKALGLDIKLNWPSHCSCG